jgi:transposase-like protein
MDGLAWVRKQVEEADTDLLREMVKLFCERVMSEEADAICGAPYGERSDERTNRRNGYRSRPWDTRTGTIDLAVPKLREGSYFPDWLLEPRRRAERAFVQVVCESYVRGVSTRRIEGLVRHLGIERISRSRVSEMAKELDHQVEAFRSRPLDGGPYTYLWLDALTQKVREGGRIANVACVIATGVNAAGAREILGLDLHTSEDGAGWTAFLRGLVARGLSGVHLVISDAHPGLVDAIASTLPGASWQRCRTHFLRNLLTKVPKSAGPFVATIVRSIFAQPDAPTTHATTRKGDRAACRAVPRRGRDARRRQGGHLGVHQLPADPLAPDLVQQPPGAVEQGDPPSHRRRGHLPRSAFGDPARRHGPLRAARRVGRGPPLHERGIAHQGPPRGERTRGSRGGEGRARGSELMVRMTLWSYTTLTDSA